MDSFLTEDLSDTIHDTNPPSDVVKAMSVTEEITIPPENTDSKIYYNPYEDEWFQSFLHHLNSLLELEHNDKLDIYLEAELLSLIRNTIGNRLPYFNCPCFFKLVNVYAQL